MILSAKSIKNITSISNGINDIHEVKVIVNGLDTALSINKYECKIVKSLQSIMHHLSDDELENLVNAIDDYGMQQYSEGANSEL